MNTYPETVAKIVDDYLERLRMQLRKGPGQDQNERIREIQAHIYEAYQQESVEDEVTRILRVLRNFGEPALFGIPLGFGGVAVLSGIVVALSGLVVSYYVVASAFLLASGAFLTLGMSRIYEPDWWDRLLAVGIIQMDDEVAMVLDRLSPSAQGNLLILFAIVAAAVALAMFWLGRYIVRGVRFLFGVLYDWGRQAAQRICNRVRPATVQLIERLERA
jgi:hypothetical protein